MSLKRVVGNASRKILGEKKAQSLKILSAHKQAPAAPKQSTKPDYGKNTVINHPRLNKASIIFKGVNNILYCEPGVVLKNCKVQFNGDNSLIYINNSEKDIHANFYVFNSTTIYVGEGIRFHDAQQTNLMASENKNIIIGNNCLFSLNTWFRTSDNHPLYDIASRRRLNPSKSILIGDHVWLGQNVTVLKGSVVGSGSIVGASSLVSGKRLQSNTSYAGTPVREIKQGIAFTGDYTAKYTADESKMNTGLRLEDYVYSYDLNSQLTLEQIDKALAEAKTSTDKLNYVKRTLASKNNKNRFYVGPEDKTK